MCVHALYFIVAKSRFSRDLEDQYVREHEEATFSCEVYPEKSLVLWMVNGNEVTDTNKFKISANGQKHKMVIKDAVELDEGTVSAIAGEAKTEAQLIVQGIL